MSEYARPDSPVWWIYLEATRTRERTAIRIGRTVAQRRDSRLLAHELYHQRSRDFAARIHKLATAQPAIRFALYAETYQRDTIASHKGAERERELLAVLIKFFGTEHPARGTKDDLLSLIDRDRVKAYHTWRRAQHVSARTINREVDLLKAMLRDAVPKYLEASPLIGMPRLKVVTPKRRLMQPAEERRLLAVAKRDPYDYALLVLGLDTLVRLGDLLDLKRTDRDGLWLYIADPKGDDPYEVPLSRRAARALDALKEPHPYFFAKFRRAANPRDWRGSVRQRLAYLCRQAIPPIPFGKAANGLTFHWATRRTGASRLLVKQRCPVPVVQKLGNWKTPDTLLEIYTEAERGDLLAAVGQPRKPFTPRSRSGRKVS